MGSWISIDSVARWWKSLEMFSRPVSLIPGRWHLFEYYTEPEGELINVKEDQLKNENGFWVIEFRENGQFIQTSNLPVRFIEDIPVWNWRLKRNYLKMVHPDNKNHYEEFQFTVERGLLKLLKKDFNGRIMFFGFFKKQLL
jgi:hypothetical protein